MTDNGSDNEATSASASASASGASSAASASASALIVSAADKAGMEGIDRAKIDAIILRAAAIGRLENNPMSVSSLASYVNLPRQTVSRRVHRLSELGMLTTRRDGNRTIVETTEKARRRSLKFANSAISETIEFVRQLEK